MRTETMLRIAELVNAGFISSESKVAEGFVHEDYPNIVSMDWVIHASKINWEGFINGGIYKNIYYKNLNNRFDKRIKILIKKNYSYATLDDSGICTFSKIGHPNIPASKVLHMDEYAWNNFIQMI